MCYRNERALGMWRMLFPKNSLFIRYWSGKHTKGRNKSWNVVDKIQRQDNENMKLAQRYDAEFLFSNTFWKITLIEEYKNLYKQMKEFHSLWLPMVTLNLDTTHPV